LGNQEGATAAADILTKERSVISSTRSSLILTLVTTAQFMVAVDFTIVQIALPTIGQELNVSLEGLQWIVIAYGITLAGLLLLCGRISDIYL
jgi:MFS family permease